jgi:hypothetical protein
MSLLESTRPSVTAETPEWRRLKDAVAAFRLLQRKDGALAEDASPARAGELLTEVRTTRRTSPPSTPISRPGRTAASTCPTSAPPSRRSSRSSTAWTASATSSSSR